LTYKPYRMKILIINGPNLNLLGKREPEIYGDESFDRILDSIHERHSEHTISYYQSNIEGEIIDALHAAMDSQDGIVLNAGGYTHTSVSIADAVKSIGIPVIEVHITNIYAREEFRKHSFLAPVCKGSVTGLGSIGYRLAVDALINSD